VAAEDASLATNIDPVLLNKVSSHDNDLDATLDDTSKTNYHNEVLFNSSLIDLNQTTPLSELEPELFPERIVSGLWTNDRGPKGGGGHGGGGGGGGGGGRR